MATMVRLSFYQSDPFDLVYADEGQAERWRSVITDAMNGKSHNLLSVTDDHGTWSGYLSDIRSVWTGDKERWHDLECERAYGLSYNTEAARVSAYHDAHDEGMDEVPDPGPKSAAKAN